MNGFFVISEKENIFRFFDNRNAKKGSGVVTNSIMIVFPKVSQKVICGLLEMHQRTEKNKDINSTCAFCIAAETLLLLRYVFKK